MSNLSLCISVLALLCRFGGAVELQPRQSDKVPTNYVEIQPDAYVLAHTDGVSAPDELGRQALQAAEEATANLQHEDIDENYARILKHYQFLKETVKKLGQEKRERQAAGKGASLIQREASEQPGYGPANYPQPGAGPPQTRPDYKAGYYTGFYQGYYTGYQQVKNYSVEHPQEMNLTGGSNGSEAKLNMLMSMEDIQNTQAGVGAVNSYVNDYQDDNGMNVTNSTVTRPAPYDSDEDLDNALFLILYICIGIVVTCAMCLAMVGLVAVERKYTAKKAAAAQAKADAEAAAKQEGVDY